VIHDALGDCELQRGRPDDSDFAAGYLPGTAVYDMPDEPHEMRCRVPDRHGPAVGTGAQDQHVAYVVYECRRRRLAQIRICGNDYLPVSDDIAEFRYARQVRENSLQRLAKSDIIEAHPNGSIRLDSRGVQHSPPDVSPGAGDVPEELEHLRKRHVVKIQLGDPGVQLLADDLVGFRLCWRTDLVDSQRFDRPFHAGRAA